MSFEFETLYSVGARSFLFFLPFVLLFRPFVSYFMHMWPLSRVLFCDKFAARVSSFIVSVYIAFPVKIIELLYPVRIYVHKYALIWEFICYR